MTLSSLYKSTWLLNPRQECPVLNLANAGDMRRGLDPWVRKIPWRRAWQLIPVFQDS